jgi:hypothetical protein
MTWREGRLLGAALSAISGTSSKENDRPQGLPGYPEKAALSTIRVCGKYLWRER